MAQIKITLVNSPIGRIPAQRKTVKALGLGKLNSSDFGDQGIEPIRTASSA